MTDKAGILADKKRGPKRRLEHDPAYRAQLVALYPLKPAHEIAKDLGVCTRTVERDIAALKREAKGDAA